jgi:hypothetical protein
MSPNACRIKFWSSAYHYQKEVEALKDEAPQRRAQVTVSFITTA